MTSKQLKFANEYLIVLNATQAAIRAGYSAKTAYSIGWENLKKPEIIDYIKLKLSEQTISAEANIKLISDTAQANLTDYFVPKQRMHTPSIKVGLQVIIDRIQDEIEFEDEYRVAVEMNEKQNDSWFKEQEARRDRILRYKIELKRNPNATRIIDGETEIIEVMDLDINALVADKEKGKVKSVKYTQFGMQVEMYSATDAQDKIARINGSYKKDNEQLKPVMFDASKLSDEELKKYIEISRKATPDNI